jgi:hypothetical protein
MTWLSSSSTAAAGEACGALREVLTDEALVDAGGDDLVVEQLHRSRRNADRMRREVAC